MVSKQILKQSVGLDVSKDSIAACFCQCETAVPLRVLSNHTFNTTAKGYSQLLVWIDKYRNKDVTLLAVMEATGAYYEDSAYFLHGKSIPLSVLLPSRSSAYAKSLPHKSKTDKSDAQMLAQLALERSLPLWHAPSSTMLKIKRLCRERSGLIEQRTVANNRSHACSYSYCPDTNAQKRRGNTVKLLNKQVADIEKEIAAEIEGCPVISRKIAKVRSIPGIGFVTAATIVAETNGFALFENKAQLVSYAGFDVVTNESGTSIKSPTRISKKGNSHIRKALYFPALTAVKWCPKMKEAYNKMFAKSLVKMKAYVGIQRKLLVLIYTIYKSEVDYDTKHEDLKSPKK